MEHSTAYNGQTRTDRIIGRWTQKTEVGRAMQALSGQEHSHEPEVTAQRMMFERSDDDDNGRLVSSVGVWDRSACVCSGGTDQ